MRKISPVRKAAAYVLLTAFAAFCVFPLVYTLLISLKTPADAFSIPFKWKFKPTFKYHKFLWIEKGFLKYLVNSLLTALGTVCISVPAATFAAYGLVRYGGKLESRILQSVLSVRMFPQMLLVMPYFIIGSTLSLIDTRIILILIVVAANQPYSIWLMRGFIMTIPKELDEAATIDGCGPLAVVGRIILPVCMPGIATASIFSFLMSYNEYLFALVLTGTNAKTLPVAIGSYAAEDLAYWSVSAAGVVGIIIPVILIMLFLQKYFVKGLTAGAIK